MNYYFAIGFQIVVFSSKMIEISRRSQHNHSALGSYEPGGPNGVPIIAGLPVPHWLSALADKLKFE